MGASGATSGSRARRNMARNAAPREMSGAERAQAAAIARERAAAVERARRIVRGAASDG